MKKAILPIILLAMLGYAFYYFFKPQTAVGPVENGESNTIEENQMGETDTAEKFAFPGVLSDGEIKNKKAIIETDKGNIVIELYADKAPKTVSNFVYLADNAFYDNLTFHRVESGFVIQGGDPNGNGTGGPGYSFPDETVFGEYIKGAVAMANSGPNTNGSQFFICLDNLPDLPKKYNLFGQVTSGMDVVDKIERGDVIKSIIIEPLS